VKTAVVLMNLGGPDSLTAVKPFLFHLFKDPAILKVPNPFRYLLAKMISWRREKEAQKIYQSIGGKSPLREETEAQTEALESALGKDYKVFIAMRYWHPFTEEAYTQVKAYAPDQVVLLPLYPHYSTTTTASSLAHWKKVATALIVPTYELCCYPLLQELIAYYVQAIERVYQTCESPEKVRLLFTAHGLPERVVAAGDPYPMQVKVSVEAIIAQLSFDPDYVICYQSKIGPLAWLKPDAATEIERAGHEGKGVILIPISFVSEHSETLYELDQQYKKLAEKRRVPFYFRLSTPRGDPQFIKGLARMVKQAAAYNVCDKKRCCQKGMKDVV